MYFFLPSYIDFQFYCSVKRILIYSFRVVDISFIDLERSSWHIAERKHHYVQINCIEEKSVCMQGEKMKGYKLKYLSAKYYHQSERQLWKFFFF